MTIGEIARLAGVSTSSVSNYFNRPARVGAATAARIRAAVGKTGYVPDVHRPGPKTGERVGVRTGRILLLAAGAPSPRALFDRPWGTPFLEWVNDALHSRRLVLQLAFAAVPGELPDAIARRDCDGVIVLGSFEDGEMEQVLEKRLAPLPSVRCFLDSGEEEGVAWRIGCDNRAAGILAAGFLRRQGHRRVAVFNSEGGVAAYAERAAAFRRAARLYRMEVTEFAIPAARLIPVRFHPARFRTLAEAYKRSPAAPTGVFFCSDDCMAGVCRRLRGTAKEIDLRHAVGCGGDERILSEFDPRPASVALPFEELGRRAVELLAARLRGDDAPAEAALLRPALLSGRFGEPRRFRPQ